MRSDVEKVLGDVRRQLDAVGAGWGRAMAQARLEEDAPGVSAVRFDREGGSGGGPSRPTEDAALRRRRSPAGDLEAALAEAADAVHRLAGLVASSVPASSKPSKKSSSASNTGASSWAFSLSSSSSPRRKAWSARSAKPMTGCSGREAKHDPRP